MTYFDPLSMYLPPDPPLMWRYADPHVGQRVFLSDDLWTVRMLAPGGTINGQSLILLAREAIGLALAAEEQGARLFQQGVQSDLTLSSPMTRWTRTKRSNYAKPSWRGTRGPIMRGCHLFLEGGLKAARIGLTAQESQYIEARHSSFQDIARIFRIPDVLLGHFAGQVIHLCECRAILSELCQIQLGAVVPTH